MHVEPYRTEIESLHQFFVDWYAGSIDTTAFDRLEAALDERFEMVTPAGERIERSTVVAGIREQFGTKSAFDIEIENVAIRYEWPNHALVRYEERQRDDGDRTGRLSTVVFANDDNPSAKLRWIDLHETWLVPPSA